MKHVRHVNTKLPTLVNFVKIGVSTGVKLPENTILHLPWLASKNEQCLMWLLRTPWPSVFSVDATQRASN